MTTERRKFTYEFKEQVANRLLGGGITQAALSRETGVDVHVIGRWKREYVERKGWARTQAQKDHDLSELNKDKRIRELEMENEILKKASAYFARHVR